MSPHPPTRKHAPRTSLRGTLLLVTATALVLAMPGVAQPPADPGGDAQITVDFHDDDRGFNVTSTKDISNVIVELCDGSLHKHDDLEGHYFNHTEAQGIVSVYVKSGNNGIEGNDPPGAGERFVNEGVECNGSSTTTTTSQTTTTTSKTETETEEIPFFGGAGPGVVAIGALGALGGAFLMLRRRL